MTRDSSDYCCKVQRSAREYGLSALDDRLVRRYADDASLRDLAHFINRAIFESALQRVTVGMVGDPETLYDLFTDEEATAGRRTRLRAQLEREGVPVEDLESAFVSHQTVRDHLRDCLDVDTSRSVELDTETARATIGWAHNWSSSVIEKTVTQLDEAGELQMGEFTLTHNVRVTCDECGRSYHVEELLDRGRCGCGSTNTASPGEGAG